MSTVLDEESLARAEGVLHVAMLRLDGGNPLDVYTSEGYHLWLRSVVFQIVDVLTAERAVETLQDVLGVTPEDAATANEQINREVQR